MFITKNSAAAYDLPSISDIAPKLQCNSSMDVLRSDLFLNKLKSIPWLWQSFITLGSCNHLMRIISTYFSNRQRKVTSLETTIYVSSINELFKFHNQIRRVRKSSSYLWFVANNKTINSPTSKHCYFCQLKVF